MKKEFLTRALYYTLDLIEKEEKHGDHLSSMRIANYKRDVKEIHKMILELENTLEFDEAE